MATTEDILTDLPFFGNPSETQLLAIQNLSRQGIEGVSRQVFNSMQSAMVSGLSSGLRGEQLKDLMRNSIKTNVPRSENIIVTLLGDYRRSVIGAMALGLPEDTEYEYIGPDDEKTRPICRTFLASGPLTKSEIRQVKPDAYEHGGGVRCRHYWSPIDV